MITYSIRKRSESAEHHIFEGKLINKDPLKCSSNIKSICQKVSHADTTTVRKSCLGEQDARNFAAELGRKACGICVSHLYATPE